MSNDPLDIVFLTKEERLAKYLAAMRPDLQEVFLANFQRISPADLAALRERIAELEAIVNKQNAVLLNVADAPQENEPENE